MAEQPGSTADQPEAILARVLGQMDRALIGQQAMHRLVLAGFLSRGHLLLEGMPGLGKTSLIVAMGRLLGLSFGRVQFTPDLMPSDILGTTILEERAEGGREFVFKPGPVFTNILLADEINRASPKTQAALLEAMQERAVTAGGQTRVLPSPFVVLASQNPVELEGTYALPEAQLDRFSMKIDVRMPQANVLESIITDRRHGAMPEFEPVTDAEGLAALFAAVDSVALPKAVASYIARLVHATHPESPDAPPEPARAIAHGASPRAAIALADVSRAIALIAGRRTVGFEDVAELAGPVLRHRIILNHEARFDGLGPDRVIEQIAAGVEQVPGAMPRGMALADGAEAGRG